MYDVCIIGAGVVGMNIARELAKYQVRVCVLERKDDVGCGCSKANSGIVHGGYSDHPGTRKAELCVKGNQMYAQLDSELHFGYRKTGSLVLAFTNEELPKLQELYEQGVKNGVSGLAILTAEQTRQKEPHLSENIAGALYCENAGVTSPYEFVIALAENAVQNGVELKLNHEVVSIEQANEFFLIHTSQAPITTRFVINSAGIYSDKIAGMVGLTQYQLSPRRGQYVVLDKDQNYLVNSVIFQVPSKLGKGILVTTTYHGNLMIGPNAEEIGDKDDVGTDAKTLEYITETARKSVPGFNMRRALRSFAGNRPISNQEDWIIEESKVKRFINLVGIDSPGLTSSPAIALEVITILRQAGLTLTINPNFRPQRPPIIQKKAATFSGSIDVADPTEHLLCRCEQVTEAEIVDSLHRGIPLRSVDAVARRTRAGFGSCQGAFCGPRVRALIAKELGLAPEEILERNPSSSALVERAKRPELFSL